MNIFEHHLKEIKNLIIINKKILSIFIITAFIVIYTKNIKRIIGKLDTDYFNATWQAIYTLDLKDGNKVKTFNEILN